MMGVIAFVYGVVSYGIFFVTFLYSAGFLANVVVPKGIDTGASASLGTAVAVNLALLGLFAVQHTIMARPAFKRALKRVLPPAVERSTFVLASSVALILLFWQWRPLPGMVWEVRNPVGAGLLWGLCALGWLTVLLGTFMIDHFHLFGLRQVWSRLRGQAAPEPRFQTRWLYRFVRHPLMLGFMIAFWATPKMSWGHLLFAVATTAYIVIGTLAFEERDLAQHLGASYQRYLEAVPPFVPVIGRSVEARGPEEVAEGEAAV